LNVPEAEPAASPNKTSAPSQRSNLVLRVVSAVVLAPLAIAAAYAGGWAFILFWALAAAGILWEWFALVGAREKPIALGAVGCALLAALGFAHYGRWDIAFDIVLLGAVAAALLGPSSRRGWLAAGTLYAAAVLLAPMLLRADASYGFAAILFLCAVVWATDILAYFVGRAMGGPKLAPRISPNKTWSGALGGAAGAVAVGVAAAGLLQASGTIRLALVAVALSVVAQAGDLFESWVKRRFGAKNSSELIPGHGGLLDRLDGFVAAALAGALIGIVREGMDAPARGLMLW
jgi:phosphatidate cytidylyltransferase